MRFRILEFFLCPTFDHVYSAAIKGFRGVSGIMWYNNFNPDARGWLPTRGTGRPGGHAIRSFKPTRRGKLYGIWHRNSWGEWGYQRTGNFVIPEPLYQGPVGGWWALRSVVDEGGQVPG